MPAIVTHRQTAAFSLIVAVIVGAFASPGYGQETPSRVPIGDAIQVVAPRTSMELIERTAKIVEFKEWLTRVDGFDPKVVSVIATDKNKLRVQGLEQGVTTMVVTDRNEQVHTIEVFVMGDARLLQSVLNLTFPNSAIHATMLRGNSVLLRGWVTDPQQITSITEIAQLYSPNVVNQVRVGGPQEVQLRVKILEVQRSKLRQYGLNFAVLGKSAALASTPGPITPLSALTAPIGGPPTATLTPNGAATSLGFGVTGNQFGFEGFLQALKTEGLLKIQAEPVLVTRSGEAAQLDNGGEFPIPVPQSLGTVTIEWREFGVILQALPIVISPTRLRQQVYAEVSEKDVANAITMNGTTVPGISRRRVQSTVEMEFGQTLVLGGLINTKIEATIQKTPFLGELPLIGAAFTKTNYDHSEVELIIMITPEYVSPVSSDLLPPVGPGRSTTFPTDRELYMHGLIEVPAIGPECGPAGGACDPNFSVNVRTDTPWPGTTISGTPVPTQTLIVPPTTGPSVYRGRDAGSPTIAPPIRSRSGDAGLIAPPGVGPGDPPPPSPSVDPSAASRTRSGSGSLKTARSLAPRTVVPRPQPIVDGPAQAGFQSIGKPSAGSVEPASGRSSSDTKSLPAVKF